MTNEDKVFMGEMFRQAMLKGRPAESSLIKYRQCVEHFFGVTGIKRIADLETEDLENFIIKMRKRKVSDSYIANIISAMRWLLFGYEKKYGRLNDIIPKEIIRPSVRRREVVYLSEEEVGKVLETIKSDLSKGPEIRRYRFYALIAMLVQTGARIGEVLSINIDDIDRENREVVVLGKGKKERTLFLTDDTLRHIDKYLSMRPDNHPALFTALNGRSRWQQTDVNRTFKRIRTAVGLKKKFSAHTLRHTFGTLLHEKGVPLNTIQYLMGHSSPVITMKYYIGATEKSKAKSALKDEYFDFTPKKALQN
jgi:integrase